MARDRIRRGDWVRVKVVAGPRTVDGLGRVTELPWEPGGLYTVFLDDGPILRLPGTALALFHSPAFR